MSNEQGGRVRLGTAIKMVEYLEVDLPTREAREMENNPVRNL